MLGHQISLVRLSLRHICQQIVNVCVKLRNCALRSRSSIEEMINFAKERVRPYYINNINNLPIHLRSQIIEKTMIMLYNDERRYSDHEEVYLLAILLDDNIKQIKFSLCFCRYHECKHLPFLLKLLASEGGLKSLDLLDLYNFLDRDKDLLHQTLLNMNNLTHLMLGKTATDDTLKIIGKNCTKLVILDLSFSIVTNTGLMYLFLEKELQDICPLSYGKRVSWSRFKSLLDTQDGKHKSAKKEEQKNTNSLCKTLKVLRIGNTQITIEGGILALLCIPQLVSFGKWSNIIELIKRMDKITQFKFPYNIIEAAGIKTTVDLYILAQRCPEMKTLHICEPFHSPDALKIFSYITSLNIIDISTEWIKDFYNYLQTNGQNLQELKFTDRELFPRGGMEMNLREILDYCPNLRILHLIVLNIIWTKGHDPSPLIYLRQIHFARLDALAIVKMLSLAPKLEEIYIICYHNLTKHLDEYLEKSLTNISESNNQKLDMCYNSLQNLRCFYIHKVCEISINIVKNMLNACKQLEIFGNIWKWNLYDQKVDGQKVTYNYIYRLISAHPNVYFSRDYHSGVPNVYFNMYYSYRAGVLSRYPICCYMEWFLQDVYV